MAGKLRLRRDEIRLDQCLLGVLFTADIGLAERVQVKDGSIVDERIAARLHRPGRVIVGRQGVHRQQDLVIVADDAGLLYVLHVNEIALDVKDAQASKTGEGGIVKNLVGEIGATALEGGDGVPVGVRQLAEPFGGTNRVDARLVPQEVAGGAHFRIHRWW